MVKNSAKVRDSKAKAEIEESDRFSGRGDSRVQSEAESVRFTVCAVVAYCKIWRIISVLISR